MEKTARARMHLEAITGKYKDIAVCDTDPGFTPSRSTPIPMPSV